MGMASWAVTSFLGGEWSQFAQGRFDRPDYKTALNVCLNAFPVEIGPWTRRPGTQHGGFARGGVKARVVKFDFEASAPVSMEFTDGFLRFRNGAALITTNDSVGVTAVSAANPAVVQTSASQSWATGNTVIFPGASTPLLENRQFTITEVDSTHFAIADAITGVNIDGSTLGALVGGATVARIQEVATTYLAGTWSSVRAIQAETTDILLQATQPPQALTVTTLPSAGVNPVFALNPATLNDGPYLDPFTTGVTATPNQKTGIIQITLSFPAYSATTVYPVGAFVTSSSVNYVSLVDQNLNNTPASSPSQWAVTSASSAVNNGQGFLGGDVGRLIRLFSEPAAWASGTSYSIGNIVSYNPSGVVGANTYWQSLTNTNSGHQPGTDTTNWSLLSTSGAATWSWGKIVSLLNIINRSLSGSLNIGNMTAGGGLAAAFDGITVQPGNQSAELNIAGTVSTVAQITSYVGKNYSGASAQQIGSATAFPPSDNGFSTYNSVGGGTIVFNNTTINLRAKQTNPANSGDGTLLGTTGLLTGPLARPATIISSDTSTAWNYVWIEIVVRYTATGTTSYNILLGAAEVQFFSPSTTGTGDGVNVELLGPPLLYTNPIVTWRLGVYSGTTGYPTCGTYHEGRLWLGGCVANRWDASVANGISGGTINFAPTDQYGVVSQASAISYLLNSDDVNQIQWMIPDLQGVIMGTLAGEWLTQAPTTGPIAATNVASRRVTKIGCANIEPRRTEHTLVFIKRYQRKIMEYFADVFSGKFSAPNLADKAQHITRAAVAELAYTEAVTPIIWGRCNDGSWFGSTYKRDALTTSQGPTYAAFHRHSLGTGRTVQSICSGPSTDGALDTLTMATADANGVYHVEVLTNTPDELTSLTSSWFLDDAVNPTSVIDNGTSMTINGLWHLNGKTVQVFAGGLDCGAIGDLAKPWIQTFTYVQNQYALGGDLNIYKSIKVGNNIGNNPITDGGVNWQLIGTGLDFVVSSGSITVPYGDSIAGGTGNGLFTQAFATALPLNQIVVGCTYNSDGQLVRPQLPQETGARSGPAFSKISRLHFIGAQLVNTLGMSFGTNFSDLIPARFVQADEVTPIANLTMFSGMYTDIPDCAFSRFDEKLCWRIGRPFPGTIAAIGGSLQTQDQ